MSSTPQTSRVVSFCSSTPFSASIASLGVEEGDVERRVVDDQLGVGHELTQLGEDVGEARLAAQEFGGEPVHLHRARVDGRDPGTGSGGTAGPCAAD